jgi:hypothetical protein
LIALFDIPRMKPADVEIPFASKLNHRVAVVVPAGCHVEGHATGIEFGQDIYTFFVRSWNQVAKQEE